MSDYVLTILGSWSRSHSGYTKRVNSNGSYELNPIFVKDVDALRVISPRFLLLLVLSVVGLMAWAILSERWSMPQLYAAAVGFAVMPSVFAITVHLSNLGMYALAQGATGITGNLQYGRWLTLKISAITFAIRVLLLMFMFVVTGSWFFVGGALASLNHAIRFWLIGRSVQRKATVERHVDSSRSILEEVRANPNNLSFDDLRKVLDKAGFEFTQERNNHYTFTKQSVQRRVVVSMPKNKAAAQSIYVDKLLGIVDAAAEK
ncbi:MAG: hypothetical protein KF726_15805 [Anaerolineae bacterium]|nr:hypothetical protein [Anaerolineae bacterium]